jgi:sensor histidine kinase regulating citrate/malate metabolism
VKHLVKLYNGIQFKMTVGFILLISLVVGTTFYLLVSQGKDAVKEQMREELVHTATFFAKQIDGNTLSNLKPGDEMNTGFWEIIHNLRNLKSTNNQIVYAYTLRGTKSDDIRFIVDEDNQDNYEEFLKDPEAQHIDQPYEDAPIDDINKGYIAPWASEEPYTDEWGTFMTGYAPIMDSTGKVVAVMAIDMNISTVLQKQDFLDSLVYYVIIIAIIFSVSLVFYFSTTITKPVIKLKDAADKITSGEDAELPPANRNDEVAELTSSMEMLIAAFKFARDSHKGGKK